MLMIIIPCGLIVFLFHILQYLLANISCLESIPEDEFLSVTKKYDKPRVCIVWRYDKNKQRQKLTVKKGETQKATEWIGIYAEHIRKVALVTMNIIAI